MSTLPCDGHGGVARGRLLGFYATLLKDNVRYGTYKRYCQDCMARTIADYHKQWLPRGVTGNDLSNYGCTSCGVVGSDTDHLRRFYVTCYPKPDTRVDYEAMYCDDCGQMAMHQFGLEERTNGRH